MTNRKLNAVITIGGAVTSALKSSLTTTKDKVVEIGSAVKKLEREQRMLSSAIGTFGRMGKDVDSMRARYAGVTAEIERQKRALEQVTRLEASRKVNQETRKDLRGKIGETAAVGAAVVFPAGAAVKRSADFNYQLQVIGNTADMSKSQVKALGNEILTVSDEVGKSAQTVQGSLGFLVAAGMDVGTARGVIRSVGRTATATASDMEDVAKASFTLNDALKIQPGQMYDALGKLVQAGKEGNFEFKDMAAELPVLGAGLQALKMTGAEAVATIGAALQIARKGAGTSSEAANNAANFINKVLSPETLKKAKALNSDLYGVISDAQKKGQNPIEAAIAEIDRITKHGDQKLLGELFQDTQVQNFLRPMLQNLEEYRRIKAKVLAADHKVVDRDFQLMSETARQQLDEMGNAAGRAAIAIGNTLEPAVMRLTGVLTPVVRSITDFVNGNQALVGGSIIAVGSLTALRVVTLGASLAYTVLKGSALSVAGVFTRVLPVAAAAGSTALALAVTGARAAGAAFMFAGKGLLWAGRALLLNPIGLAVTGLAGGAYLIYKNWSQLKPWFTGMWADITGTFNTALKWISEKIAWVGDKWRDTKQFFGVGNAVPKLDMVPPPDLGGIAPPGAPAVSKLPPMAVRGGPAAAQVNTTNHNNIIINQQPGQDARSLAQEVLRELDRQKGIARRSMMYDAVAP